MNYSTRKLIVLNQIRGYNEEHLIDNIEFTIPVELTGFNILLTFVQGDDTPIGAVTLATPWTSGTINYVVPIALTVYNHIKYQVVAAHPTTQAVWKSNIGHIYFDEPLPDHGESVTGTAEEGWSPTITLDTPGTLSTSTTNNVTVDSHTHAITTTSTGAANTIVATGDLGNVSLGNVTAASVIKSGGTSSQFLKADGSVDSNTYSTTSHNHNGTYEPYVGIPSLATNAGKVLTVNPTNSGVVWSESTGGGSILVPTYTRTTLVTATNSAAIGTGFDPSKDSLTVFKNSVYLAPNSEYTVVGTNIVKTSGTWANGTIFDFVVTQTQSSDAITNVAVHRISSSYTATSDSTTNCLIGTTNWNSLTDSLYVYYQNLLIFPGVDYTINANGVSIDLTSFSINTGEVIHFEILRNIHTAQASVGEPQMLGSADVKAVFYNSNTIAENLTITSGINSMSAGPIVISNGYTVSIAEGARWVIV